MRTLTIQIPEPGDADHHFDVIDQHGCCCNGLTWGEMLEQVAALTIPTSRVGKAYPMKTPEHWEAKSQEVIFVLAEGGEA